MNKEWYVVLRDKTNPEDLGRHILIEAVDEKQAYHKASTEYVNCEVISVFPAIVTDTVVNKPIAAQSIPPTVKPVPKRVPLKPKMVSVKENKEPSHLPLFYCEDCNKTFRDEKGKCPLCQKQVEGVVKKVSEKEPEAAKPLEPAAGGVIEKKVQEQEQKVERKIIAKGITDKADADKIAAAKKGKVVSDEDDPKKFMVITEAYVPEQGYLARCKLEVTNAPQTEEFEVPSNVDVSYELDMDERSWGIKDFTIRFVKPITIFSTEGEFQIEPENIEVEWQEGSGIYPWLVTYDYNTKRAYVSFYYWKP